MDSKERLIQLCETTIAQLAGYGEEHEKRMKLELKAVDDFNEHDYFLDLHDRGVKIDRNENNLLIALLLGICEDWDESQQPVYIYGEFPDIDVDFKKDVRMYLKDEWAPKTFGPENVCNIGSYNTFGIKSSLIDMAKVFSADRDEVLNVTTKLGLKDDEGKTLTWERALELNKDLAEYCKIHPDIAKAAKRMLNRIRSRGKHAGGLIISRIPIADLVPLCTDSDGNPVSAWTEGLHAQDLQPVGLVKYDVLGLTNLEQLAQAARIILERADNTTKSIAEEIKLRHGIENICALPGRESWSDISYLNDPKALALANQGKLRCIFQFDSAGMRELVKRGGVYSFDDLAAYTALYRPGPLGSGMATNYCDRKNGLEHYEIHPLLEPVLGKTFGVLVYQEQVMKILNIVGDIPLKDCELVRKAISKKKVDKFIKYKNKFLEEGQKRLEWPLEDVVKLWDYIEAFADYGFNMSHAVAYTYISSRLLWLKAHYPLEFFTAILSCEEDEEKVKEYKLEAEKFGIAVNRVDLNKSKVKFSIVGDSIYIGFANIKGIGEEVAKRIVAGQPYASFEDFLTRFGTDAAVIKPLIGLRVFKDTGMSAVTLYEFAEYYKEQMKKRVDRDKRNVKSRNEIVDDLVFLAVDARGLKGIITAEQSAEIREQAAAHLDKCVELDDDGCNIALNEWMADCLDKFDVKQWKKYVGKYKKNVIPIREKQAEDKPIVLEGFEPPGKIDEELAKIFRADPIEAEDKFYGFGWEHMLEKSPDYEGYTFGEFRRRVDLEDIAITVVEVRVIERPVEKKSKTGNPYYVFKVEDAEWQTEGVTMWDEDYKRFESELQYWESDSRKGHLLKVRLERPKPPFKNYTFESPPKAYRHKVIPKEKKDDVRLTIMERPSPTIEIIK